MEESKQDDNTSEISLTVIRNKIQKELIEPSIYDDIKNIITEDNKLEKFVHRLNILSAIVAFLGGGFAFVSTAIPEWWLSLVAGLLTWISGSVSHHATVVDQIRSKRVTKLNNYLDSKKITQAINITDSS